MTATAPTTVTRNTAGIIGIPDLYICFLAELRRLRGRPAILTAWNESTAVREASERYDADEIEAANRDCSRAQRLAAYLLRRLDRLTGK